MGYFRLYEQLGELDYQEKPVEAFGWHPQDDNIFLVQSEDLIQIVDLKANEVMERLKASPYEELQSSSTSFVLESEHKTVDVLINDFNQTNTLKKIVVTVTWLDHKQRERQYMLTTLRSQFSPVSATRNNHAALHIDSEGGRS